MEECKPAWVGQRKRPTPLAVMPTCGDSWRPHFNPETLVLTASLFPATCLYFSFFSCHPVIWLPGKGRRVQGWLKGTGSGVGEGACGSTPNGVRWWTPHPLAGQKREPATGSLLSGSWLLAGEGGPDLARMPERGLDGKDVQSSGGSSGLGGCQRC